MIFAPRDLSVALADGLTQRGHDVFFFTAPDIKTQAHLMPGDEALLTRNYDESKLVNDGSERAKWAAFYTLKRNYELDLTQRCYKMAYQRKLDIVHSYHDSLAHFMNDLMGIPTVYTLHDPVPKKQTTLTYWLLEKYKNHNYVSISNTFRKGDEIGLNFVDTVHHGLDASQFTPSYEQGEYIAYMGRLVPEKGPQTVIEVGRRLGIPVHLASSSFTENHPGSFIEDEIKPHIDGAHVVLVPFMSGDQKSYFLSQAKCFLLPITWEEPFGMVMLEAMASGLPVIAYNRGSVSEIVRDGLTGFIVDENDIDRPGKGTWVIKKQGIEGLMEAVKRVGELDRKAARTHVEESFSLVATVKGYERVYRSVLASHVL
jgi:glycosyltransferase involved in cell wall biosynthesis